ncbi:unnamed protein product [Coffea canephora]|uniref:DH200=94 genomic scaffold, scaffold_150 n=1 Tax=Coffea canephora TaxID=49390 RepID=A0A068V9U9_COFCA|nr:unnamed protein product [Coffea canephora]
MTGLSKMSGKVCVIGSKILYSRKNQKPIQRTVPCYPIRTLAVQNQIMLEHKRWYITDFYFHFGLYLYEEEN